MEQEAKDTAGITRSQHTVLTLPHDQGAVAQFLTGPVERIDPGVAEMQLLVITADVEGTTLISSVAAHLGADRAIAVVPATTAKRATRLLRERGSHIVVGAGDEILALIQSSTLKLGALRAVVLAWIDEGIGTDGSPALEAVMAEIPKEASRTLVASRLGPEAQQLAERYVRRGLRGAEAPAAEGDEKPVNMQYVAVSGGTRAATLRRLLDELDPAQAAVWTRSAESEEDASRSLSALGYRGEGSSVRVVRGGALPDAGLVVLYDVPGSRAELRALLGTAVAVPQLVVLAQPRQLPLVRALASGGRVTPLTLAGPATAARRQEEGVRAELRAALEAGLPSRELLALEPLLETYDGVELAAAALHLLEQERAKRGRKAVAETAPEAAASSRPAHRPPTDGAFGSGRPSGAGTKLFLTIGERDGVRPGDLVGAIAATAGITGDNIGKIELRDTHALVEIIGADAAEVAEKITGANIKGRRVVARLERDRPPRDEGARGFAGSRDRPPGRAAGRPAGDRARPPREFNDRGDRPPRSGGDRPPRGGGDRPPRSGGARGYGGDRPDRGGDRPRRRPEGRGEA